MLHTEFSEMLDRSDQWINPATDIAESSLLPDRHEPTEVRFIQQIAVNCRKSGVPTDEDFWE